MHFVIWAWIAVFNPEVFYIRECRQVWPYLSYESSMFQPNYRFHSRSLQALSSSENRNIMELLLIYLKNLTILWKKQALPSSSSPEGQSSVPLQRSSLSMQVWFWLKSFGQTNLPAGHPWKRRFSGSGITVVAFSGPLKSKLTNIKLKPSE